MAASREIGEDGDRSLLAELISNLTTSPEEEADRLLRRRGSLGSVIASARRDLNDPVQMQLHTMNAAFRSMTRARLMASPVISTSAAATEHLMLEMAHLPVETIRLLFLNGKGCLVADEILSIGTIDQAPLFVREVIRRALEVGAVSLVLAHNHPSGDPTPSRQDIALTQQIQEVGAFLDITVVDHLILASSGWASLRTEGHLP